ncbi:MAG: hypothetical protein SF162_13370 [bacterium]|nr:hypothetical protein [bacterium]
MNARCGGLQIVGTLSRNTSVHPDEGLHMRIKAFVSVVLFTALLVVSSVAFTQAQSAAAQTTAPPAETPLPPESCQLTAADSYANVRTYPSINAPVALTLDSGETALGLAKTFDNGNAVWYFTPAGWIAEVAVTISDGCARLFTVQSLDGAVRRQVRLIFDARPGAGDADTYAVQDSMYGNAPRIPAITLNAVTLLDMRDAVVCDGESCGRLSLLLFAPQSGRVTNFFASTPQPGVTPLPPSFTRLLFTSPAECIGVGQVCLVAIVRESAETLASCPAARIDSALPIPPDGERIEGLTTVIEQVREAALASATVLRENAVAGTGVLDCPLELLIPVNEPNEPRFFNIDGGLQGIFYSIRLTPPVENAVS